MSQSSGVEIILKYFPELSEDQIAKFGEMEALYKEWNSKINVISRKDIDALYTNHVLHSLGISTVTDFLPGSQILDVGTGGGFPGIPLAIAYPDSQFLLVDSIGKKIRVVNEVSAALGLSNVKAIQTRAESVEGKFDFVVSRAVTRIGPFYQWIKHNFAKTSSHPIKNGVLYLKGGDLKEELQTSKLRYKIFDLDQKFDEAFFETKKVVHIPHQ